MGETDEADSGQAVAPFASACMNSFLSPSIHRQYLPEMLIAYGFLDFKLANGGFARLKSEQVLFLGRTGWEHPTRGADPPCSTEQKINNFQFAESTERDTHGLWLGNHSMSVLTSESYCKYCKKGHSKSCRRCRGFRRFSLGNHSPSGSQGASLS
jgi:hypothetical protein